VFVTRERAVVHQSPRARRSVPIAALAILATGVMLTITGTGRADSMPVGPLPAGPVSTIKTGPNQLVAVALPRSSKSSGLVWRIARPYKSTIVRQISEADVGGNVVLVFRVTGRGTTSLVFALTRGDTSPKGIKSATQTVVSR
jgi:hypothetical protein